MTWTIRITNLVAAFVAALILYLNALFFIIEQLFLSGKAAVDPSKSVVVITGCDSGFGEMTSRRLSAMGFRVVSGCLTEEGAARLKGTVALAVVCNVAKEADIAALFKETEGLCSRSGYQLWALINNAGIGDGGALDWTDMSVWRRVMEINFFGVVAVTKAMLPLLKRTPGSRIINLSSMAGLLGSANLGAYFASKHAVEGMAKCLRQEMAPWGISVSNINPAFMRTPILTSGVSAAHKSFEAAPKDITSEYDPSFIDWHMEIMNQSAEDPALVVQQLVNACTDKSPPMWYFPGVAASILRVLPMCSSPLTDAWVWLGSRKGIPQPTAEAFKKYNR